MTYHLVNHIASGEYMAIQCPKCRTECSLIMRENHRIEWACETLDCGFTQRLTVGELTAAMYAKGKR